MKKLLSKIKNFSNYSFVFACALVATVLGSVPAFAEGGSDISTVTSSVTSAITASKADFVSAIGSVVAVGIGWFLVKFVVMQVVNYFKRVASK